MQKQRRADGCQRAASARQSLGGGGWYHPSSGSNRWQFKTKQERARRGLATVATQHSGSYVGLLVWRSSSRPEASGRDLPRKWCWSRRWSTWCSSSLHEPWNASRKSSGCFFLFVSIVTTSWVDGGIRIHGAASVWQRCLILLLFAPRLRRNAVDCFSGRSPTWCRAWVNKRRRRCGGGSRSVLRLLAVDGNVRSTPVKRRSKEIIHRIGRD